MASDPPPKPCPKAPSGPPGVGPGSLRPSRRPPPGRPKEAGDRPVVLVVDDSAFGLRLVTRALENEDYHVLTANGGAEGLQVLEQYTADVVITDLLMPHISGLAFLSTIRKRYPSTRVIVCSADIQEATGKKARSLGAAAFLNKPVDPEELQRIMRLVLSQNSLPRELLIGPQHTDAFKEIFNIGVGRAAAALSKLVYEDVKLSIPELVIIRPSELPQYVWGRFSGDVASVRQDFTGTASGSAYLLISASGGLRLVNALVAGEDVEADDMTDTDRKMLIEVGNILINSLVGSLANTLGIAFDLGHPEYEAGGPELVHGRLELTESDYVLFLETLFVVPGRQIGGNLVILVGSTGMGHLLQRVDRLL